VDRLRVAVTGLAVTYPFGGVFWDYVLYLLGLHRLGHDVLYIEDTGRWCYDPVEQTFVENGARNAASFAGHLARLEPALADRWFYRDGGNNDFGRTWEQVVEFCATADVFLHVSVSCWMREEYFTPRRVVFIDSDPMFTQADVMFAQATLPEDLAAKVEGEEQVRLQRLLRHDVFFTFGENIGADDCRVPSSTFAWHPTRQPVVLDCFAGLGRERGEVLTTVGSWAATEKGCTVDGVEYGGKGPEFERFIDLPSRTDVPLELALAGEAPVDRLREHGWRIRDGFEVSHDPWVYRDYLAGSLGEWSVAKNAYVASNSGWFSCRTACYLAAGVPAVVQDTGFSRILPTGEGLFAFSTLDEAAAGIEAVASDPARHGAAAQEIAREYFDSDAVLTRLLEQALT
jgi:hypothetical protein